jgi:hypothetical protein
VIKLSPLLGHSSRATSAVSFAQLSGLLTALIRSFS